MSLIGTYDHRRQLIDFLGANDRLDAVGRSLDSQTTDPFLGLPGRRVEGSCASQLEAHGNLWCDEVLVDHPMDLQMKSIRRSAKLEETSSQGQPWQMTGQFFFYAL